jgi:dolichol-phosphate mannosyltransferase
MQKLVVIPTYNEASNIERLAQAVLQLNLGFHLLFVDDASPDGTGWVADRLAVRSPQIAVLHRPRKMGLGSAYREGFRYALQRGAELIFAMDADLSHDPAVLPDFLAAIEDHDLVIGSRYVRGGHVQGWPLHRLLLSRSANIFATCLLALPLRDCTSGFKCFRRQVLEAIDVDRITSDGYAFQLEMHYHALHQGFRVAEIPIVFRERQYGSSKISRRIVWEAFWLCVRLRASLRRIVQAEGARMGGVL